MRIVRSKYILHRLCARPNNMLGAGNEPTPQQNRSKQQQARQKQRQRVEADNTQRRSNQDVIGAETMRGACHPTFSI